MTRDLRAGISRAMLRFARSRLGGRCAWLTARLCPQLMPGVLTVERHYVLLRHPRPIAPEHLLILPRSYLRDARDRRSAARSFWDGVEEVLGNSRDVDGVTNLGERQEVALLHVHLLSNVRASTVGGCDSGWISAPCLSGLIAKLADSVAHVETCSFRMAKSPDGVLGRVVL